MAKRIGFVVLVFFALVLFDLIFTVGANVFSSLGPRAFAGQPFGIGGGATAGLSSVNFAADFKTGGPGWAAITQGYGRTPYSYLYIDGWHNGVDIAARYAAPVYSPDAGTVLATGNQDNYCPAKGFGKFVAVRDDARGVVLWYAHLGTIEVAPGQTVQPGMELATIGATGLETGTHLHLSVFEDAGFSMKAKNGCGPDANGRDVDPVPYLKEFGE